jgi:hypothetical protein
MSYEKDGLNGVVQTRVTLFPVSALLVGAAKKRVSKSLILAALL